MGGSGAASVIVVGAGVFGLATGLALAEAGMKVRLVAATPPDLTASGVAAGMLAPAFEVALDPPATDALGLLLAGRDLWPDLARGLGVSLDRTGAAAIGPEAWLDGLEARLAAFGLEARPAGRAEMEAMASGLGSRFPRAFVTPEDWRIEPQAALQAMAGRLHDLGGTLEIGTFTPQDLEAAASPVVLATGVDRRLEGRVPELAGLSPIKGQILWRPGPSPPVGVIRTPGSYLLGSEGGFLAGATMEAGRSDLAADLEAQVELRGALADAFPSLATEGWVTRVGVRAATPDGLPLAGASVRPGVFLAVGARRNGWLLAPLVAEIVTAAVTGEDGGRWAPRLDPSRFAPGAGEVQA
jgi:glycine oxidase